MMRLAALALTTALIACSGAEPGNAQQAAPAGLPFKVQPIGQFAEPFAMAFLPDGSLLVTEKAGTLKLRKPDGKVSGIGGVPAVATGGQGGLLDVAVAPDFARSGTIYLSYSEPKGEGSQLALLKARLVPARTTLVAPKVIWRSGSEGKGGQFGAIIAFAPDGKSLFLSSGERQRFTPAQDPNQGLGKILHLTLDGAPAAGNPGAGRTGTATVTVTDPPKNTGAAASAPTRTVAFPGTNTIPAATWSTGHRNPYGLAFDAQGRLWETEMGPKGGDELNLILPGRNYGWPNVSNGDNYDGSPIPRHAAGDGYEAPKLFWNPAISPGGFMIYSGTMFPAWNGSGFIAALSAKALIRVTLGDTPAKADQWDMGTRIRDVAQAPDGAIWLLEDGGRGAGGKLMRLTRP
jgi:glucose/arabinose dehydrogenase